VSESLNDGMHDDQQAGEPSNERPSERSSEAPKEWRSDWSGSRFTEPPNRPSSERAGKPASDRQNKPAGDRPGDRHSDRPSDRQSGRHSDRQGKSASDPVADFQRWLMKAGARSMANQVADNVRRTIGQPKRDSGDIWDTATTEAPTDEAPECQWCPVCQAARRIRESNPGLGDRLASAGGVLASVVQDAFSAVEQVIKTPPPDDSHQDKAS
jgi:hypothetical protein